MSISTVQITLVQSTFALVSDIPDTVAELFYSRLFEIDPALRPLFKRDMKTQGQMLMSVLAFAVASLNKLDTIVPAVQALGARHVGYGVKKEDYNT